MTSPTSITGKYGSAAPFFTTSGSANVTAAEDVIRLQAYDFYDNAYFNRPEGFTVTLRGAEDEDQIAITLPAPKKVVEAVNRFFAIEFDYAVDAYSEDPSKPPPDRPSGAEAMSMYMNNLFKREKLYSKFNNNKRFGLVRGDALWHITADDTKLPGQRISVHTLDPRNYFPIADAFDPTRIAGCHLVDVVQDPREKDDKTKKAARVQTYRRTQDNQGVYTGEITSELAIFELAKWDDRNLEPGDLKKISQLRPPTPLDSRITQLPVYHWRNKAIDDTEEFGSSELAGIEVLFNAINQSITDEDLTLVMQGLGMYWTNAAPPVDETGAATNWEIGPRTVVEVGADQTFGRVTGVTSTAPFLEHIKFLDDYAGTGSGIGDIATGRVDVTVAESGISLLLQLMPLLAANREKELELVGVHDQMLFDISRMWMPAYEQTDLADTIAVTSIGDAMPVNREARINEIVGLVSNVPPLMTMQMAIDELSTLGYNYPDNAVEEILADSAAITAAADPFAGQAPPGGENTGEELPSTNGEVVSA